MTYIDAFRKLKLNITELKVIASEISININSVKTAI